MSLNEIITPIFWIAIFILLLVSKKYFVFPNERLSKKAMFLLVIVTILVFVVNGSIIGFAYYKAYNPDYEYEKISGQVSYHIYRPSYLPPGIEQNSKFYIEEEFAGNTWAVRSAYNIPISQVAISEKSNLTVITQTQVDDLFDAKEDVLSRYQGDNPPIFESIVLPNFPNKQAYFQTGGFAKVLHVVAMDNVYISIASPRETEENLQKMGDSLE